MCTLLPVLMLNPGEMGQATMAELTELTSTWNKPLSAHGTELGYGQVYDLDGQGKVCIVSLPPVEVVKVCSASNLHCSIPSCLSTLPSCCLVLLLGAVYTCDRALANYLDLSHNHCGYCYAPFEAALSCRWKNLPVSAKCSSFF